MKVKMQKYPCRSHLPPPPAEFGEEVCGDTIMAYTNESWGLDGEEFAAVLYDRGTKYIGGYPKATKSAGDQQDALYEFLGQVKCRRFYSDCAPDLIRAAKDLGLLHDTATPYRHNTNAVAERAVRKVIEGTKAALEQAGLPPHWWPWAMPHWCHSANIETVDGDSAWNRRHEEGPWTGPERRAGAQAQRTLTDLGCAQT